MLYIHVPFCRSFCTYCDFYSEIACRGKDEESMEKYVEQVCREISERRDEIEAAAVPATIYIGGGTPSVLSPFHLRRIVEAAGICLSDEFTVEVNPEDIVEKGEGYVKELLALGVSRISMGVQSLDDGLLKWMNRRHDADGARKAFAVLRKAGADNISVDVIFGISQLDDSTLEATIDEIASWGPDHISAYQLSIEEGSALGELVRRGQYHEAPEDQCRRQYDIICRTLAEAGYRHYEISNWAKPGREAVHNSAYWKRLPYVGIGPGAHSFNGKERSWNSESPLDWTSESETLSREDARVESIMLGLRTDEGIDAGSCSPEAIENLVEAGSLVRVGSRIRIPESSFFVSDDIIRALI